MASMDAATKALIAQLQREDAEVAAQRQRNASADAALAQRLAKQGDMDLTSSAQHDALSISSDDEDDDNAAGPSGLSGQNKTPNLARPGASTQMWQPHVQLLLF